MFLKAARQTGGGRVSQTKAGKIKLMNLEKRKYRGNLEKDVKIRSCEKKLEKGRMMALTSHWRHRGKADCVTEKN